MRASLCILFTWVYLAMAACPPGHFMTDPNNCHLCLPGTFNPFSDVPACYQCADGFVSGIGASVCTECRGGKASNANRSACVECGAGMYADLVCVECPVGRFNTHRNATECEPCPVGRYSNATGAGNCTLCEANTHTLLAGQSGCVPCERFFFKEAGETECRKCVLENDTHIDDIDPFCFEFYLRENASVECSGITRPEKLVEEYKQEKSSATTGLFVFVVLLVALVALVVGFVPSIVHEFVPVSGEADSVMS